MILDVLTDAPRRFSTMLTPFIRPGVLRPTPLLPVLLFVLSSTTFAQIEHKLTAADGSKNALLGWSVALSDEVAIVGAPGDSEAASIGGSAYIYRFDGLVWIQEQKLTTEVEVLEQFGYSVAISGNTAAVGMPYDGDNGAASGSVFVYQYDGGTWVEEQKLTASDAAAGDLFGWDIAVTEDFIVATAGVNDGSNAAEGAAYVFRRDGAIWAEEQKLEPGDIDSDDGDYYGWSVAASGDVVVVGALGEKVEGFGSGSAYVYRHDGEAWAEEQRLAAGGIGARFGADVAISEDVIAIGAPNDIDFTDPPFVGSTYVFRRVGDTWEQEAQLTLPSEEAGITGGTVALAGDLVVTAGGATPFERAYVFRREEGAWSFAQTLAASDDDPGETERFGTTVAVSGARIAVGAPFDVEEGVATGSAYVFDFEPLVASEETAPTAQGLAVEVYPNPHRDHATVRFAVREPGPASVRLYDLLGRELSVLYEGPSEAAAREVPLDVRSLPSGTYLVRLEAAGGAVTQQVTVTH